MSLVLYDLCGAEPDRRFSPYCWRTRMALHHKRLDFESVPIRFSDKDKLAFSGQDKVPVLVHDDRSVHDSWDIAEYLEARFPDRPSLFGGEAGKALSRFHAEWANLVLNPALIPLLAGEIHAVIHEDDKPYFRQSREARFGKSLEDFTADREGHLKALKRTLAPLRTVLAAQPFLAGEAPLYADYAVFGGFMWAANVSQDEVLEPGDPVRDWRDRVAALIP